MKYKLPKFIKNLAITAAVSFLIVGVLICLLQLAFPFLVKRYKVEVETLIAQQLQQKIQVSSLSTAWHGITLVLKLQNVLLINAQSTQPSLRIHELKVGINLWLILIKRQFTPTLIVVNGTHLVFHQHPDNSLSLDGLNIASTPNQASPTLLESMGWLLSEPHIVLQNIDLDWYDKNGEHYIIDNINVEMLNKDNRHRLWGKLAIDQQHFAENAMAAKLKNAGLELVLAHSVMRQQVVNTNTQGNLQPATFSPAPITPVQSTGRNKPDGISVRTAAIPAHLSFNIDLRGNWQHKETLIAKTYIKTENWALSQWSDKLAFLNLQSSSGFINAEVWADSQADQLQKLQSIFSLEKIQVTQPTKDIKLGLQSAIGNLIWTHKSNINNCPAIKYLGIEKQSSCINLSHNQIALAIEGRGSEFNHKNLFANALKIDQFQTHLLWQQKGQQSVLKVSDFSAMASGMKLQGQMTLTDTGNVVGPEIRLLAGISGADAKHLPDYLPVGILKPKLTHWLLNSIKSGRSPYGTLVMHGPLNAYPFENHDGAFIIQGTVRDATLNYMPGWPVLQHINGELTFDKHRMRITSTGEMLGANVKKAEAIINDLGGKDSVLQINSSIQATLAQGQEFINTSPLQRNLGKAFAELTLNGPISLELGLTVPLKKDEEKIHIKGDLTLNHDTIDLTKWQVQLQNFNGLLHFTEHSVSAQGLQASVFKQPILINMRTLNQTLQEPVTEVEIKGNVTTNLLKQQLKLKSLDWLKGGTAYNAVLRFPHSSKAANSLYITSNLKGVSLDLPRPLGKFVHEQVDTALSVEFLKTGTLDLKLDYGDQLAALLNFQKNREKLKFNQGTIKLTSPSVSGEIVIPDANKQVRARFQYLYITPSTGKDSVLDQIEASDLPPLDIIIEDFHYAKKRLGRTQLITEPTADGLYVKQLNVDIGAVRLHASGDWIDTARMEKTHFKGQITSNDVAAALSAIGIPPLITANTGNMGFNLTWAGSPTDFKMANLNGNVDLQLAHGSIVDIGRAAAIKMNLGRILNLLSLESLPHRLNFRANKVTLNGFNFDSVAGDFNINDGHAVTDNTQLRGEMAAVDIKGRLGLASQDYDTYITVVPHLATGLPLVATIVGGPLVGALAWVADKVVSKGTEKMMTHTYHMTGSWKSPDLRKIETDGEGEEDE
ncbi:DUF3971 domain-containing protein [soil metagenome]